MVDMQISDRQHQYELLMDQRKARREAATEYARQSLEYSLSHATAMKEYGQQVLRTLFLMNGGGILTIFTFVGASAQSDNPFSPPQFVWPLGAFVSGLVCCAFAMLAAYYNFQLYAFMRADIGALCNSIIELGEEYPFSIDKRTRRVMWWSQALAVGFGLLSAAAFLIACWQIGRVFLAT